ncbi:MAG: redoxin domain-containing protein [Firmicutes bacterium]|nr:redoxin domain-containing protein [Bacillota bacterium]
MNRLARLIPIAVLAAFAVGALVYSETLKIRAQVGAAVPAFSLPDLTGEPQGLDGYRGRPVIINFWASWCEPCREEMPAHEAFYRRFGDRIGYLGINHREAPVQVERHLTRSREQGLEFTFPILLDRDGAVGEMFRVGGVPETWFVDGSGVARRHWLGPVSFEQLAAAFEHVAGRPVDEQDGGPFHGTAGARSVLLGSSPDREVYVGGEAGLARYRLESWSAPGPAYEWEPFRPGTGGALVRDAVTGEPLVLTGLELSGLPGPPAQAAAGHGRRLAWVPGHGLYADEGAGWQRISPGLAGDLPVLALAVDGFAPERAMAATAAGLMESVDGGRTWQPAGVRQRVYGLQFDPLVPLRVYLATDTGIWVSDDGGRTARRLVASPQRVLVAVDALEMNGETWLAAVAPNGDVYGSRDAGRTWELLIPRPGVAAGRAG